MPTDTQSTRTPAVRFGAWLGELETALRLLKKLENDARGPGKHRVFMCVHEAKKALLDALDEERSRSPNDKAQLQTHAA